MPNSKRGEGQGGQGQGQGGQGQGGPGQNAAGGAQGAREQIQQGAAQVGERLRDGYESAREGALHGYRQAEGSIARNPGPSVLIGFGVGFGLGLVLCSMFTQHEETWAEKYLPDSLQDMPDRYQSLVSSLKSLPKTVHQHLPQSVAKHLG